MGAFADILLAQTDPLTAMLILGLYMYIGRISQRVRRLEDVYIPDGAGVDSLVDRLNSNRGD